VFITVAAQAPVAQPVTLAVMLNTPTTADLRPYISGTGVTGIAISVPPAHGSAEVNGTRVTYTPKQNYFGPDAFSYYAIGTAGASPPAVVSVVVGGRPDPSKDPNVVALIGGQSQVAQRFARAQISNVQRRMESLHVDPPASDAPAPPAGGGAGTAARLAGGDPGRTPAAGQDAGRRPGTGTVNLANSTERGAAPGGPASGFGVWIGGNASFGTQDATDRSAGSSFSTDGITVGGDWRVSESLLLGLGVGYAQDKTRFGNDGTQMKSDGYSVAGYASYRPSRNTFVDALLGYGTLDFDTDRYVSAVDDYARAGRKGSQAFGSVAGGFEFRNDSVLVSPYGRLDFTFDRFRQATETGAGQNALTYQDQTQRSVAFSLGLRAESQHATDFGLVRPRARAEYRHDFEGAGDASIAYADGFGGRTYTVTPPGTKRDFLLLGIGSDFLFREGLRIGFDYQWQSYGGADSGQMLRLVVSQDLDGKGWPSPPWISPPLTDGVRVDGGYTFDDNVTRGRVDDEILSDKIYSLNVATDRVFPIDDNTRVVVTGLLNGEMFHTYTGLARLSGGLQAQLQYRGSAEFDAVTYAAFARGWLDNYNSQLRDGGRYSAGISARRSLTDRIDVYGELSFEGRRAQSAVWNLTDYVARLNLDYSLGRRGTLYLTGEYRAGDTVADGKASLENLSIADVFVKDDAFPGERLFAYRFDARTWVGLLGYNLPLGPRDSIDFSWRRVVSTPTARPAFDSPGPFRYVDNQYSVVYLLRF
jgi:outer membrane autotransporter protein